MVMQQVKTREEKRQWKELSLVLEVGPFSRRVKLHANAAFASVDVSQDAGKGRNGSEDERELTQ